MLMVICFSILNMHELVQTWLPIIMDKLMITLTHKRTYPPVIEYCWKKSYRTKNFDTLNIKALRAVGSHIGWIVSHAIFVFNVCDKTNCCFHWFFFDTVLFISFGNSVLIKQKSKIIGYSW